MTGARRRMARPLQHPRFNFIVVASHHGKQARFELFYDKDMIHDISQARQLDVG